MNQVEYYRKWPFENNSIIQIEHLPKDIKNKSTIAFGNR